MTSRRPRWVVLGEVTGLYGVQGWVKVQSYTEPRARIAAYTPLYAQASGRPLAVAAGRAHGAGVVLKFVGVDDRDSAAALLGQTLAVARTQLPVPQADEIYWTDLAGLRVVTTTGVELGVVERVFATGANDVLVVRGERERLVPFLRPSVVQRIDLEHGLLQVEWDPEF